MFIFNKTPLIMAIEKENIKIIELILNHPNIDVNINYIFYLF